MNMGQICDYIILVSAVLIALKNIYEFFAKPTQKFKTKRQKHAEAQIGAVVEQKMEVALAKHDEASAARSAAQKAELTEVIKTEVIDDIKPTLDAILEQNRLQNISIETLTVSSKDMLRQRIMAIYHANKKDRTLTENESEVLEELYKDYKAQKGNSYIDKYYNRMKTWEIVVDDYVDI